MRLQYTQFMKQYIDLNHMEFSHNEDSTKEYYLPHHCVLKSSNNSTKFRVVFNGSLKTSSKLSLNDVLKVGPTIQQDLFSILVRFRKHLYAFTADIIKMYRQVIVREEDRDLQKIWWRDSPDEPLRTYRLRTVTYGTACAPYLATRTLRQLALDEKHKYPEACQTLMSDFYVDDVLTGADNVLSAKSLRAQLIQLLSLGCFQLSKFASNFSDIESKNDYTSDFLRCDDTTEAASMENNLIQILGINWDTDNDYLSVALESKLQLQSDEVSLTKRHVLSQITQIFDPLGLCAPIVFYAKCFMQKLWTYHELSWDDQLPIKLQQDWIIFRDELRRVKTISIPRCLLSISSAVKTILHGFGDASEYGYGCCIYLTCEYANGQLTSRLVSSKSRVAPLHRQTIPRLEPCASVLLSQLMEKVVNTMDMKFDDLHFWTDSIVTLCRIKSNPSKYGTFVANRIALIQELSHPNKWQYVPTHLNPADIVSRGLMPTKLQDCEMWWNGPKFINDRSLTWPCQPSQSAVINDAEFRKSEVVLLQRSTNKEIENPFLSEILSRYSKLSTLLRTLTLCLRFAANCRRKKRGENIITESLRPIEIENTTKKLILRIQKFYFHDDRKLLKRNKTVSKNSKLLQFAPFIDDEKIVRVGGRLHYSNISYEQKHPILLPDGPFSHLIGRHTHVENLHVGPQALLNIIRKKYWMLNGRNICRKIVHQCVKCFKMRPITQQQIMGQLPYERVNPSRPFLTVGIDFCGPFHVSYKVRSKITSKVYVAVFVCFCTKACHLEVVHDLTTGAFIAAFRRFISRRGFPSVVFTDNATNFCGAQAELKQLLHMFNTETQNHELLRFCTNKGITWKTIPPRSPHFGGLWEAAVKSAKYHLKRTILIDKFTAEELTTITSEIEAVLNSRPLTPMSSNPNDLSALTPGHLLIGDHLTAAPDPTLLDLKFNCLSRWQRIQYVVQTFWKRWTNDYLSELQQRQKWHNPNQINVGSMVLIKDDNLPSFKWILARIVKTYEGADGNVRVVDVKTSTGIFKRSIARICILPFDENLKDGK